MMWMKKNASPGLLWPDWRLILFDVLWSLVKMIRTPEKADKKFPKEIDVRERRKLRARKKKSDDVWFGLGMFGVVGWAIAIPTVMGVFLGVWIDIKWPSQYSWTLMLLLIGLITGYMNAWFWINRQRRDISREREDHGD